MKNIPIKFRGVNILDTGTLKKGETICGRILMQYQDGKVWLGNDTGTYVDPDSISQLIGFDSNGEEIYEGDSVSVFADKDDDEPAYSFTAALLDNGVNLNPRLYPKLLLRKDN